MTTVPQQSVSRLWGTAVTIGHLDLAGIVHEHIGSEPIGAPFARVPPESVLADDAALRAELLDSMNAVAACGDSPPVTDVEIEVQVWRGGYDQPATSYAADYVSWCFLAASSTSLHSESGAITLADPRAGSALTAMPGMPWGRQMMIRPTPGAHAAAPGWLTCSVVPVEEGQHAVVAVATSIR